MTSLKAQRSPLIESLYLAQHYLLVANSKGPQIIPFWANGVSYNDKSSLKFVHFPLFHIYFPQDV